jgi:hypothetical protein
MTMIDMSDVLYRAVEGLAGGLPQAMIDFYRIKQDRTAPEQYGLELQHDLDRLNRDYELRRELSSWETTLRVAGDLAVARAMAERAANAFGDQSDKRVLGAMTEITLNKQRPALLLAPFLRTSGSRDEIANETHQYVHSLRESWRLSAWREDMAANVGLISNPLLQTDEDLRHIRAVLDDFPVVLIHGIVEPGKVRLEILAWNIIGPARPSDGAAPHFEIAISEPTARTTGPGELPRQLSVAATQLCAMLAEWFYVTRGHRLPCRHRDIAERLRDATAVGTLVALDQAIERHGLDHVVAAFYRAVVHADRGEVEPLARALNDLRQNADPAKTQELLGSLREAFARTAATGTGLPPNSYAVAKLIDDALASASIRLNRSRFYG